MTVEELHGLIGQEAVEATGGDRREALLLSTVDPNGWPNLSLLSAGEILPLDEGLAFCVWNASNTARNLRRTGQGVLTGIQSGAVISLRLDVAGLGSLEVDASMLAAFSGTVVSTKRDRVPYAEVLSGIQFRLTDVEPVVVRWGHQLHALAQQAKAGDVDG